MGSSVGPAVGIFVISLETFESGGTSWWGPRLAEKSKWRLTSACGSHIKLRHEEIRQVGFSWTRVSPR